MVTQTDSMTMDRLANQAAAHAGNMDDKRPSRRARVVAFLTHLLAMALAMVAGMVLLDPVYRWVVAQLGYNSPYLQLPELTLLVSAVNMTAPMAAWMRFRGMDLQSTAEMSAVMVAAAILIIGGYWLGVFPNVAAGSMSSLGHLLHKLMLPAMLGPMLLRFDRYMGHRHHKD